MPNLAESIAPRTAASFEVRSEELRVHTRLRVQLLDITDDIQERVHKSGIQDGIVVVNSLHTTLALFINEHQEALFTDMLFFLEQQVERHTYWKHNDPHFSDCDRANADAHLRAMLLGHSLALPLRDGKLVLGTFQSTILAELDGPQARKLQLQILGSA